VQQKCRDTAPPDLLAKIQAALADAEPADS
jgi:hypothetical protein